MNLQVLVRALGREAALQRAAKSAATEAPGTASSATPSIDQIYISCLLAVLVLNTISLSTGVPSAVFLP